MQSCVEVHTDKQAALRHLRQAIDAVTTDGKSTTTALSTGWPQVDSVLPAKGLSCGALHEWFGLVRHGHCDQSRWTPPLSVLLHLAARGSRTAQPLTLWIGQRVWPYGYALWHASPTLFCSSIFVAARDAAERQWAMDVVLRTAGAGVVVVADAAGMPLASSRRLQLAAEAGGTLGLLARPPDDETELSVAMTRWRVKQAATHAHRPRWSLELVRSKGSLARIPHAPFWTLDSDDGHLVVVSPDVADRPGAAAFAS